RYISICVVMVMIFSLLISYMNLLGIDQTSEYYMLYEAEVLSEHYQPYSEIIEFDPQIKEYYWGIDQLPQTYRQLLDKTPAIAGRTNLYSLSGGDVYILPYAIKQPPGFFYVIHRFDDEIGIVNNRRTFDILLVVSTLMLLVLCGYIFRLNKTVTQPINQLHHWVEQLGQAEHLQPPPALVFAELQQTAMALHQSVQIQQQLHANEEQRLQREKAFLSTLSHELRTPMAIINAALAVLEKRNELPDKSAKVVAKLSKANRTMGQLCETLLQLWRRQKSSQAPQTVIVADMVNQLIEECQLLPLGVDLSIETTFTGQPSVITQPVLLQIVIANLLRNACQYGQGGIIGINVIITASEQSLVVTNAADGKENGDDTAQQGQYGYGLGLYLVEAICQQLDWRFVVESDKERFCVRVDMV
ncbi:MAG: signal transduction histidine kinase, partial [Phenylobacterium sp.]